jgi:hypothetical protein
MKSAASSFVVIPAKAGIQCLFVHCGDQNQEQSRWIPAFAGMTSEEQGILA